MRKKVLLNRKKFLLDYLKLIRLYPKHFKENFGESGLRAEIDRILDEFNSVNQELKEIEDEENKK